MGIKPEPVYLRDGDLMELSITGLGTQVKRWAKMPDLLVIGDVTPEMRDRIENLSMCIGMVKLPL